MTGSDTLWGHRLLVSHGPLWQKTVTLQAQSFLEIHEGLTPTQRHSRSGFRQADWFYRLENRNGFTGYAVRSDCKGSLHQHVLITSVRENRRTTNPGKCTKNSVADHRGSTGIIVRSLFQQKSNKRKDQNDEYPMTNHESCLAATRRGARGSLWTRTFRMNPTGSSPRKLHKTEYSLELVKFSGKAGMNVDSSE